MKNILVTGCAGFIGSHLSEKLIQEGHNVIGIDNFDPFYDRSIKESNISEIKKSSSFKLIEGDICDDNTWISLSNTFFDEIFHLAAKAGVRPSILDPNAYIETNIIGTQKLLEWMLKSGNKNLVFASSSSVYGNNKKIPFSEDDNVDHPISPYAFTKKSCELMIHTYCHMHGVNATCLRFFTVYGPRQRPDLAIHKFFKSIHNGTEITMYGDGTTSRDYTYISDIIDGLLTVLKYNVSKKNQYDIINLGGEHPIELLKLIKEIESISGKTAKLTVLPMQPGDVDRTFADINKAKSTLNFSPKHTINNGLNHFNNWYLNENNHEKSI